MTGFVFADFILILFYEGMLISFLTALESQFLNLPVTWTCQEEESCGINYGAVFYLRSSYQVDYFSRIQESAFIIEIHQSKAWVLIFWFIFTGISSELKEIIRLMMEPEPSKRPTINQILEHTFVEEVS